MRCGQLLFPILCVLGACATTDGANGPRERAEFLGFSDSKYAVLKWRPQKPARLESVRLPAGPAEVVARLDAADRQAADRWAEELTAVHGWIVPEQAANRRIGSLSIDLAVTAAPGRRADGAIVARSGDRVTVLQRLGVPAGSEITAGPLWPAPGGRYAVLAVDQAHGRGLHIVDLRRAHAALLNDEALERYRNEQTQAASILWERAIGADPSFGDPVYNLACVHALAGDLPRAAAELRLALALDSSRFRRLARTDPDLEALRNDAAIRHLIGLRHPVGD